MATFQLFFQSGRAKDLSAPCKHEQYYCNESLINFIPTVSIICAGFSNPYVQHQIFLSFHAVQKLPGVLPDIPHISWIHIHGLEL